jgi:hypothetical protein
MPPSLEDGGHPDAATPVRWEDAGPESVLLADGLSVRSVHLFQTVGIPLVVNGAATTAPRNAPIIAGRPARVTVSVDAADSWQEDTVTAVLSMFTPGSTYHVHDVRTLAGSTPPESPLGSFAFDVPSSALTPDGRFAVQLVSSRGVRAEMGVSADARFPGNGSSAPLLAQAAPGTLRVVLVPVQYNSDGSGRLPNVTESQLDLLRVLLLSLYPMTHVELTVREPMAWNNPLTFWGNVDFYELNDALLDLRVSDNASPDTYYYALISPAASFEAYCGGSCVAGPSFVVENPADHELRVGSGLGFGGEASAWTLVHELGHMHGRYHAPCGVSSWDTDYPYDNASIGAWAYDARSSAFMAPETTDFMGYCEHTWVSDYTYAALFERMTQVNTDVGLARSPQKLPHLTVHLREDGVITPGRALMLPLRPGLNARPIQLIGINGDVLAMVWARTVLQSNEGETLLVPLTQAKAHHLRVLSLSNGPQTIPLPSRSQ